MSVKRASMAAGVWLLIMIGFSFVLKLAVKGCDHLWTGEMS